MLNRTLFPLAGLEGMRREMNRLLGNALLETPFTQAYPPINLWETDDALIAEAELPGLTMDNVELLVMGDALTLKGRRIAADHSGANVHRSERATGEFVRSLTLPLAVNPDAVEATLKDGILTVRMPKSAEARPRKIQVKGL